MRSRRRAWAGRGGFCLLSCFTSIACATASGHALRGVFPGNFLRYSVAEIMRPCAVPRLVVSIRGGEGEVLLSDVMLEEVGSSTGG